MEATQMLQLILNKIQPLPGYNYIQINVAKLPPFIDPKLNNLIVIMGPSGVGKNSMMSILREDEQFHFIKTATTRLRREEENEPSDAYIFCSDLGQFNQFPFVERSFHYGNWYGLPKTELMGAIKNHKFSVLIVKVNAFEKIEKYVKTFQKVNIWPFFIVPEDIDFLLHNIEYQRRNPKERIPFIAREFQIAVKSPFFFIYNKRNKLAEVQKELKQFILTRKN